MCDIGGALSRIFSPIVPAVSNALGRAFTAPGTGGLEAQAIIAKADQKASAEVLNQQLQKQNTIAADTLTFAKETQATAAAGAAEAVKEQKLANEVARAASTPAADSDSARIAADTRLKKLLSAGAAFGVGSRKLGSAPIGYRPVTGV